MAKRRRKSRKSARRSRRRGRFVKGSAAAKRYMASIRPKGKGGSVARRRRKHRRRSVGRNPVVRHHRRRRHYRRNPGFSLRGGGFVRALTQGAKCGAFVTLGEAVSAAVPGLVRLPTAGLLGFASRIAVGTALGVFGKGVLGAANAEYFIAGAFSGVYRQLVRQFNVPILAPALAGYPGAVQMRGYGPPSRPAAIAPAGLRGGSTTVDAGKSAGQLF